MLRVQEYLKRFSLRKLSQEFFIDTRICSELGIVCLDYHLFSPLELPIVQECRCLILEMDTWNVVCKSFTAFYEPRESEGQKVLTNFNWENAKATVKYDGALIVLYYYKNEWRVGMRKSANGSLLTTAINGVPSDYTFDELTKVTLHDMGYTFDGFTSNLNKNIFYSFELCAPETRYGVVYSDRCLYLIGAVDRNTLQDIDIYTLDAPTIKAKYIIVNSKEEVNNIMASMSGAQLEGYVVLDSNMNRLKFRNPNFLDMMLPPNADDELQAIFEVMDILSSNTSTSGMTTTITIPSVDPTTLSPPE